MTDSTPTSASSSGQLSNLRQPTRLITTHNPEGLATIHSQTPFQWHPYSSQKMAFSVQYTTSTQPPTLTDNTDLSTHETLMSTTDSKIGLVNPNGTVLRCVDFAPGYACAMHRTSSLDYGIVIAGSIDMVLDSGDRVTMGVGDVAIQRATQHQWVNNSETEWARMMFVLQDCEAPVVDGKRLGEDLGEGSGLPASAK